MDIETRFNGTFFCQLPKELIEELLEFLGPYIFAINPQRGDEANYIAELCKDGHLPALESYLNVLTLSRITVLLSTRPDRVHAIAEWVLAKAQKGKINLTHYPLLGTVPSDLLSEFSLIKGIDMSNFPSSAIRHGNVDGLKWALNNGHRAPVSWITLAMNSGSAEMFLYLRESSEKTELKVGNDRDLEFPLCYQRDLPEGINSQDAKLMIGLLVAQLGLAFNERQLDVLYTLFAMNTASLVEEIVLESRIDEYRPIMEELETPLSAALRVMRKSYHNILHCSRGKSVMLEMLKTGRWKMTPDCGACHTMINYFQYGELWYLEQRGVDLRSFITSRTVLIRLLNQGYHPTHEQWNSVHARVADLNNVLENPQHRNRQRSNWSPNVDDLKWAHSKTSKTILKMMWKRANSDVRAGFQVYLFKV